MPTVKDQLSLVSFLQCSACDKTFSPASVNTFATCDTCGKNPIIAQYDLLDGLLRDSIVTSERSMWRYTRMLPVLESKNIVT
ncbi:MAG: hypothetical protein RLN86_08340, partial [Cyclobacteriaceae bacterium]